jgi:abortive infection bacteriophage resistance protein
MYMFKLEIIPKVNKGTHKISLNRGFAYISSFISQRVLTTWASISIIEKIFTEIFV